MEDLIEKIEKEISKINEEYEQDLKKLKDNYTKKLNVLGDSKSIIQKSLNGLKEMKQNLESANIQTLLKFKLELSVRNETLGKVNIVEYGEFKELGEKSTHSPCYFLGNLTTIPKDCILLEFGVFCHSCTGLAQFAVYDTNSNLVAYTKSTHLVTGKNLIPFSKKAPVKKGKYRLMGSFEKSSSIGQEYASNHVEYFSFEPTATSIPPTNYSKPSSFTGNSWNYFVVAEINE
jgi:hypothetical protein